MTLIPLDIPSFNIDKADEFIWPISYGKYDFLSYGFVDEMLRILENQEGAIKTALTCKLSDILIDVGHVARQAIEIQEIRSSGNDIIYDVGASPTIDWLLGQGGQIIRHNRYRGFKDKTLIYARYLKRVMAGSIIPSDDVYNAISFNCLMKEHISAENLKTTNMLVEFYLRAKPKRSVSISKDISSAIYAALSNIYEFEYPVERAIYEIVDYHMGQALGDIEYLKKSKLSRALGKGLLSGTPKYEGRVLGWYFQDNGREVIRHAHGGERVFYNDYIWPIAELPYCSSYYAHSKIEAKNMDQRIKNGDYAAMPEMKSIKFKSLGSLKHKEIYKNAKSNAQKSKTLVYVSGVYLGDLAPNFPSFKTPDSMYFDFQIRLLKFLKNEGWKIIAKPHPKGLYNPARLLEPYADEVVVSQFDPNNFDAEVFLFDFAGTAFFDALASKQRTVLLNLGNRPFDDNERKILEKRCNIHDCGFDDYGRIDLNQASVAGAIENAPRGSFDDFIKRYAY